MPEFDIDLTGAKKYFKIVGDGAVAYAQFPELGQSDGISFQIKRGKHPFTGVENVHIIEFHHDKHFPSQKCVYDIFDLVGDIRPGSEVLRYVRKFRYVDLIPVAQWPKEYL